jgi:starch synthase
MNILFASSELSPFAKTGGLGDVLAALPAALRKRGHSVSCVLPLYRSAAAVAKDRRPADLQITVPMGAASATASIWEDVTPAGVKLFFVQQDGYFDRPSFYGTAAGDYPDNAARFIFFSKVAVELAKHIRPVPQILHSHDWQTGLIPALVHAAELPFRTVYTIHNLAYQGSFWAFDFEMTNLPGKYFSPPGVEFYGRLNCMKAAITLADQLTTVSPRYAEEIQTYDFGCGLDIVLQENNRKLTGILNGVDYGVWNPLTDPLLPHPFSARSLKGKAACKKALLKEMGLPPGNAPLFASVSRLTGQKGFDLLSAMMDEFLEQDVRYVLLGAGEPFYQEYFSQLSRKHPSKVAAKIGFDEGLAHRIEAGADFFLMPSRFEPCGLNQMYSLRYGTIPIVHETGGLADSVENYNPLSGEGTGFRFSPYDRIALARAVEAALDVYRNPKVLARLRRNAMRQEFSWNVAAAQYEKVYERALAGK